MAKAPTVQNTATAASVTQTCKAEHVTQGPDLGIRTMRDALLALQHLNSRGLLCSACGYGWAVVDNSIHSHCCNCKREHMTYNVRIGKGSEFEHILQQGLQQWVTVFLTAVRPASANPTDSKSQ